MKYKDRLLKYLLYFALITIGIIAGIAVRHYYNIPVAETINIVDLATLVVTIFLAVYIPEVLDRKLQIKRDKKDLIERHIEDLQSLYRRVNLLVQDQEVLTPKDFRVITNSLDISQHKLETITALIKFSALDISFDDDIKNITMLNKNHTNLLLTNKSEDENFTYTTKIQQEEETLYNKLDKATSLMIFKISDA